MAETSKDLLRSQKFSMANHSIDLFGHYAEIALQYSPVFPLQSFTAKD
jgi:hypothetical protein